MPMVRYRLLAEPFNDGCSKIFIDEDKSVDWFGGLERNLRKLGSIRGFEIVIVLCMIIGICQFLPEPKHASFLMSALFGL